MSAGHLALRVKRKQKDASGELPLCKVLKIYSSGPWLGLTILLKVDKTPCQEGLTGGVRNSGRAVEPRCPLDWVPLWGL